MTAFSRVVKYVKTKGKKTRAKTVKFSGANLWNRSEVSIIQDIRRVFVAFRIRIKTQFMS